MDDRSVATFTCLFIEDDRRLAELTTRYLLGHGALVHHFGRGDEALRAMHGLHPEVVLLDWMLPDGSGLDVCRRIRTRSDVPIVMLTARDSESDRVAGLEAGADDYVVKPYSSPELLARLKAQVRRARGLLKAPTPQLAVGPLRIDVGARSATLEGRALDLTTYEFDLLAVMAARPGQVLSREQLIELVTGAPDQVFDRAIDVHVSNLRTKLGDNPRSPKLLKTVRGVGYMLAWGAE